VPVIQDRLDSYDCRSALDEEHAVREIIHEIVLGALGRADFFRKAGLVGGTSLRILHGSSRYAEDLKFALETPDPEFDLRPYLDAVARELTAYGFGLEIDDPSGPLGAVRTADLRNVSICKVRQPVYWPVTLPLRKQRVRLAVDTDPAAGATFEIRSLAFPFASAIRALDLPSLFAGRLHAQLCRENPTGGDWYDFIWFTDRGTLPNYELLRALLNQSGPWRGEGLLIDRGWCLDRLRVLIRGTDWAQAREEVRRSVTRNDQPSLEVWSRRFFLAQCGKFG
jgi:hypothetical protein